MNNAALRRHNSSVKATMRIMLYIYMITKRSRVSEASFRPI